MLACLPVLVPRSRSKFGRQMAVNGASISTGPGVPQLATRASQSVLEHHFFLLETEDVGCVCFGAKGDAGEATGFGCFGFFASRLLRF